MLPFARSATFRAMPDSQRLLLTQTGYDAPGILAEIARTLDAAGADLLDVQQVTIAPLLVIALLIQVPGSPGDDPASLVPVDLLRLALRLDLQLRVHPYTPAAEHEEPD